MSDDFFKTLDDSVKAAEKAKFAGLKVGLPQDMGTFYEQFTPEGRKAASTPIVLPAHASGDIAAWEKHAAIHMSVMTVKSKVSEALRKLGIKVGGPANWQTRKYFRGLVAAELARMGEADAIVAEFNKTDALDEFNEFRRLGLTLPGTPDPWEVQAETAARLHKLHGQISIESAPGSQSLSHGEIARLITGGRKIERGDSKQAEKNAAINKLTGKGKPTLITR